jgi:medium-chain acyl-[acyl-carrier-protein] hydrolase
MGESLVDCVERLADLIADTVAAENSTPYALFGHSMGSLVAFETCHEIAARNAKAPELLIVSGHRAPHLPPSTPPLHAAPDSEFIAHLRELGATPPEVFGSPELLDLMLPILRSDFRACETYIPSARSPLQTAIAVYGGLADEDTSCASLRAWEHETTGVCMVRMFPGGHFFLRDCANKLVAMLEHDLANAFKMHRAESHGLRC